eukprot:gene9042-16165_t
MRSIQRVSDPATASRSRKPTNLNPALMAYPCPNIAYSKLQQTAHSLRRGPLSGPLSRSVPNPILLAGTQTGRTRSTSEIACSPVEYVDSDVLETQATYRRLFRLSGASGEIELRPSEFGNGLFSLKGAEKGEVIANVPRVHPCSLTISRAFETRAY